MHNSLKANVRVKENRVLMFSVEAYDTYDFWGLCIYAEVVSLSLSHASVMDESLIR